MNSLDIRIITINDKERLKNVKNIQQQLNISNDKIFIDYERKGCRWNSKRAFTYPTNATHVLVLSDDVKFCNDFLNIVNVIINNHPNKIISLFDYLGIEKFDTPYLLVNNKYLNGPAIIIPTYMINNIFNFEYNEFFNKNADDTHIMLAAMYYDYDTMLIVPNLIQCIDFNSTIGHAQLYSKSFNNDISDINFDTDKVINIYCH